MYLVRHGESEANIDKTVYHHKPDHAIDLTEGGRRMARGAGEFIRADLVRRFGGKHQLAAAEHSHLRLWVSPFTRTRQTAEELLRMLNPRSADNNSDRWVDSVRESAALAEQDFGVFEADGNKSKVPTGAAVADRAAPPAEVGTSPYAVERHRMSLKEHYAGLFWSRPPQGESLFDVSCRLSALVAELTADILDLDTDRDPVRVVILVAHGNSLRGFVQQWCRFSPEWLSLSQAPPNCSVQLIEGSEYKGFPFSGFCKRPRGDHTAVDGDLERHPEVPLVQDPRAQHWDALLQGG